jgi:4-hydroxy-tetrahydrodipicolinate reductase
MSTRVMIAGATGWVGRALCAAVASAADLDLVAAVARSQAGMQVADVVGVPGPNLVIAPTVADGLAARPDVMVDYTSAVAVRENVLAAIDAGVHVVVGSSGLTADDFTEVDQRARKKNVGVIACGNFAITAVLLQRFAAEAARFLDQWEIIDYSSDAKIDAPSGTTRELAHRLAQVRKPQPAHPLADTVGAVDSRGANIEGRSIRSASPVLSSAPRSSLARRTNA